VRGELKEMGRGRLVRDPDKSGSLLFTSLDLLD
jgi:hypothetical protein